MVSNSDQVNRSNRVFCSQVLLDRNRNPETNEVFYLFYGVVLLLCGVVQIDRNRTYRQNRTHEVGRREKRAHLDRGFMVR